MSRCCPLRVPGALGLLFAFANVQAQVGSGAVSYNGGATQDFDTLSVSGTSSVLPQGWYFRETAGPTTGTYQADDGSIANVGDVYSYGASESSDRAFGSLATNALSGGSGTAGQVAAMIGARLQNTGGSTLTSLQVAYVGEVWLVQVVNVDRLAFEYSTDATAINAGTWTAVPALDFATPAALTAGKKDGNLPANRAVVSGTIGGLSVASGGHMWVRWKDTNISNNDNGLAIDDVVFGTPVDHPPTVANSIPEHDALDVAFDTSIQIAFSEPVDVVGTWFDFNCVGPGGTPALAVSGGPTTFTLVPSPSIGYGKDCTLTVLKDQVLDRDETADPMDEDAVIHFETEADDAPFVIDSTPPDLETDVARGADLSVTFSEPVDAPLAAFRILCPHTPATPMAFSLSSDDDTTFTLDPNDDLPGATDCRLEVLAAQVLDRDGVLQPPDGDEHISFTTAAIAPPAVLATVPTGNTTNFPAVGDLHVVFDSTVTLAPGAFTLTCVQSTGIALVPDANAGTVFTIDTGTTLVDGDSCTFTVVAAKVTNDALQTMLGDEVVNFHVASNDSSNYYQNVNLKDAGQLRCTLHQAIAGHVVFPYSWTVLEIADEAPPDVCAAGQNSPDQYILDIYRNRCYAKPGQRSGGTGPNFYNREHTWPKSLGFGGDPSASKPPSTDFHMLHLSASDYNSTRSNKPFDNCNSGCTKLSTDVNNGTGGTSDANSNFSSGSVFEVWDGMKGNMARAVMYMAIRYEGGSHPNGAIEPDLELTNNLNLVNGSSPYMGKLDTLLQWHAFDPVIGRELDRNEVVYEYQGNRNPFVDHPEWATAALFNSTQPATCVLNTTAPAANDDSYATPLDTVLNTALTAANDAVLANDSDAEGAPLIAQLVSTVGTGSLALAANGDFTYTPPNGFCGSTSFSYRASDGVRLSVPSTAIIEVGMPCGAPNNPPVANNDAHEVAEDSGEAVVNVLGNDTAEPDVGETLAVIAATQGTLGAVSLNAGVVRYTPNANANGSDSFTYTLSDGNGGTDTATVNVTILPVDDAPDISAATGSTLLENSVAGTPAGQVTATDPDAGTTLLYDITAGNGSGAFAISNIGAITVDNAALLDFETSPTFTLTVRVRDGAGPGALSDTAQVTVNLTNDNEAPTASNATFPLAENAAATTVVGAVTASDPDADTSLVYDITAGNTGGAFDMIGNSIVVADSAPLDFETTQQFVLTVNVSDGALSTTAQVTINLSNVPEPAVATNDNVEVSEDAINAALNVRDNDVIGDSGTIAIQTATNPAHGTIDYDFNDVYYTPHANYCGSDSFSYAVQGGDGATVSIDVTCANDAPVAVGTLPDREAQEGVTTDAFSVADGFDDVDVGDVLSFTATGLPDGLTLDAVTGTIDGTPAAGSADGSPHTVRVTASDGEASVVQTFEFVIAPVEPLPVEIFADGFED